MSWIEHHQASEQLAAEAQAALREDRQAEALALYARAADAEHEALTDLDASKTRTSGITAVSAASLYYKAGELERAERVAGHWVGVDYLPSFAKEQLRGLLQSIWAESAGKQADAEFAPALERTFRDRTLSTSRVESLNGVLRALHLDKDWLELTVEKELVRVVQVGNQVDDLIGPMVNKPVIVRVSVDGGRRRFLDIELGD